MAADNETTYWHLTPKGWVVGDVYEFRRCERQVPVPDDRVMTCVEQIFQGSMDSPQERTWRIDWRSADRDLVAKLEAQFGARPHASRASF